MYFFIYFIKHVFLTKIIIAKECENMKKIIKNYVFIVLTLLFTILLFKNNDLFKNCILNGCILFFKTVFPSLFPMFIINDILINYNFITILDYINTIFFQKIF